MVASNSRPASPVRPRLVVVDMAVAAMSPAGSCVLAELRGLNRAFDLTVFSAACDLEPGEGVEFVRVPLPRRPLLLRYLAFHLLVPLRYAWWRVGHPAPDFVQTTQGQLSGADLAYAHFCHRAYLKNQWPKSTVRGLRRVARWANHRLNAFFEARAFARSRCIVVPSQGLARELAQEYPQTAGKVVVLANPVAIERFSRPGDFDRAAKRAELGFGPGQVVLGFMALGDFARKGLGLLLEALGQLTPSERERFRVLVVGGQPGEIDAYQRLAAEHSASGCVVFVGLQTEVRPFLWAADIFAFPSSYEIFSLAILQAAAAGLPVMVSAGLYGAEEFVVHGVNGWQVPREAVSIADWLRALPADLHRLPEMARAAEDSVRQYASPVFAQRWLDLYRQWQGQGGRTHAPRLQP